MSTPILTGLSGSSATIGEGRPEAEGRRPADEDAARRFSDLMGEQDRQPDQEGEAPQRQPVLPGPFALFGAPRAETTEAPAPAPAAPLPESDLGVVADEVASRILVGDGSHGNREVRIQLKDGVLPDTEVRVRQEGGRLVVELVCGNADTLAFLEPRCGELAERLGRTMRCAVEVTLMAEDDQTGDRRSRQTYVPFDGEPG